MDEKEQAMPITGKGEHGRTEAIARIVAAVQSSPVPIPPRKRSIPPAAWIFASYALHSASRSGTSPSKILVFFGLVVRSHVNALTHSISTSEKKFSYMEVWYDAGWSRGIPTYSSCFVRRRGVYYSPY